MVRRGAPPVFTAPVVPVSYNIGQYSTHDWIVALNYQGYVVQVNQDNARDFAVYVGLYNSWYTMLIQENVLTRRLPWPGRSRPRLDFRRAGRKRW